MTLPEPPRRRGIPLRAVVPNAVTVLALGCGLTGVRFAIGGEWEKAVAFILLAAVLDGIDGRIARLLKATSRFGAELDSLSDVTAFGVAPTLLLYLWALQHLPGRLGWVIALAHAIACALRLARVNAQIDAADQPHKRLGDLPGIPAPAGAGLMVSNLPTYSWGSVRLRPSWRFPALAVIGLLAGALFTNPWATLTIFSAAYALSIPFAIRSYARIRARDEAARRATGTGIQP